MAISFLEKLKDLKLTSFKFTSFEKKMTTSSDSERLAYLIFELAEPIEKVTGSVVLHDPTIGSNDRVNVFASNVTHIQCMLHLIEKYESEFKFGMDENDELTGAGSYHGDLFLDVASRSGEVHLTDTKFSAFGQSKRKEEKNERFQFFAKKS